MTRRVAVATLGCRLNQVDGQQLLAALEARGFTPVPFEAPSDVVVVNTCTVTARAEFSDRQLIRRARRTSPGARVVVTGCWAQTSPGDVARMPDVDLVVGNADKDRLPELLDALLAGRPERVHVGDVAGARLRPSETRPRVAGRSRAFLKVQDGCQHRCAFCVVPLARGASRSLERAMVVEQAQALVAAGHPEIVLTGIDLGHYGADLVPRASLATLLDDLTQVKGLRWLRLSSMLPAYFTDPVLEILTTVSTIAPHFHVPLQSGSERVLRRMRRPYTVGMYRRVVERLASAIPALGLGTDLIAGFPGEREEDAASTRALVDALPFTYLHVFPYSTRPSTEAAGLDGRLPARVVAQRAAALRAQGRAKSHAFRARLVGGVVEVLVLETRDRHTGGLVGLSGNYAEVVFDGPDALMRRLARVRVVDASSTLTRGRLAEEDEAA